MESRCRSSGHRFTEEYHVLSGPATSRGTGGVQLWARRQTVTEDGVMAINVSDLRILKANSRQLIVRLSTKWANWILVVGHAPDNKPEDETEEWWKLLEVPARYKSWPIFGLLDANAQVGETFSEYIGEHGASQQDNPNGRALGEWAQLHQLFLPQTFADTHHGEHWTWEHSTGKRSRIDYIAMPSEMRNQEVRSGQAMDFDVALARTDHVAVQVEFAYSPNGNKPSSSKVATPPTASTTAATWSTDVHTHAQWVASTWKTYQDQNGNIATHKRRRKVHLSEDTWQLIGFKKTARRNLLDVQKRSSQAYCRHIFATWACMVRNVRSVPEPPSIKWIQQVDHSIAKALSQYRRVCRAVVQAVRADDANFYEHLARSTGQVAADEGIGGLWKHIKHLLPRQLQRARTNLRCVGPTSAALLEHFGDLEAGEVVGYEELVQRCAQDQEDTWDELPLVATLSQLPRKSELEAKCLAVRTGKASGLDGIDPSTIKQWAPHVADSLYFLFLKAWTLGCEPIQWKGGILHPIAKTLQPSERAQDHRGIAILEGFGKRYHAILRSRLMRCVLPIRQFGQFGGYAGQQCLFPAHILHTTAMLAEQYKLPDGALFIDIKGAFHCLLRELAMESRRQFPPRLQEVLIKEGFNVEVLAGLIKSSKFFGIDGADQILARAMQDAHRHTWFTMDGVCMETHRGTRPGSPLADLVFNAMVSVIVKHIEEALLGMEDLQACSNWLGIPLRPVVWVDDIAIALVSTTNESLLHTLKTVLAKIRHIMHEYGFTLNLARGKTECVCNFRGKDAPAFRQDIFIDKSGVIEVQGSASQGASSNLHVASSYKHLGAKYSERASIDHEIRHRLAAAQQAYSVLRRPLFANRRIPAKVRLQLLDALIMPRLLYGCGRWPLLTASQYRKINAAVTRWQRTITGNGFWNIEEAMTDQRLRSLWQIQELSVRLAKHRLLYASQIWKHAREEVWPFVCAEANNIDSWFAALRHSLGWLRSVLPGVSDLNLECEPVSVIEEWLQENHQRLPAWSRRAVQRHLLQECTMAEVAYYHEKMKVALEHGGIQFTETIAEDRIGATHKCPDCPKVLQSLQTLAIHRWKAHGTLSEERRFVFDGTCRACNKCFWSSQRLQQHLRYSKRHPDGCYHKLARTMVPVDEAIKVTIPQNLRHHRLPCCAVAGPQQPITPAWVTELEDKTRAWTEAWTNMGLPLELPRTIKEAIEQKIPTTLEQWFEEDLPLQPGQLMSRWLDDFQTIMEEHNCKANMTEWAFLKWGEQNMYDQVEQWFSPDHQLYVEHEFMEFAESSEVWWKLLEKTAIHNAGRDRYIPNVEIRAKEPDFPRQVRPREPINSMYGQDDTSAHELCDVEVVQVPLQKPPPVFRKPNGDLVIYTCYTSSRGEEDQATYISGWMKWRRISYRTSKWS